MNEIEAKARKLGLKYQTPCHGVGDCEFEATQAAIEMADWMIQRLYKHLVERCFFTEEEAKEVCKAIEE